MFAVLFSAYHFISVTWYPDRQTHDANCLFWGIENSALCYHISRIRNGCAAISLYNQIKCNTFPIRNSTDLRMPKQTYRLPLSSYVVVRFGFALKRSLNVLIPFIWHTIAINSIAAMQRCKADKRKMESQINAEKANSKPYGCVCVCGENDNNRNNIVDNDDYLNDDTACARFRLVSCLMNFKCSANAICCVALTNVATFIRNAFA